MNTSEKRDIDHDFARRLRVSAEKATKANEDYHSGHISFSQYARESQEYFELTNNPENILLLLFANESGEQCKRSQSGACCQCVSRTAVCGP